MAFPIAPVLLLGVALGVVGWLSDPVRAEGEQSPVGQAQAPAPPSVAEAPDTSLSPECRVPGSKLYTLAKLKAVKSALKDHRAIRVLSLGSSSAGMGAVASYPMKLEDALEKHFPDVATEVENRAVSGEVASGVTERLRSVIAEIEPDLVVWQVGTNDALARVDLDAFAGQLQEMIAWIKSHGIDVVLVDPQYAASLARDDHYSALVQRIQSVAMKEAVSLVQRYEAMRYLSSRANGAGGDTLLGSQFRLSDLSYRCMAEHVTRAITVSLLLPDAATTGSTPAPPAPAASKPAAAAQ